jgi:S1-C subfamily serine protease
MKPLFLPCLLCALLVGAPKIAPAQAPPSPQTPALNAPQGKVPPPLGSVDIASEPIVRVVANVQPAVVNITAEGTVPEYAGTYETFFNRYRIVRDRPEQSIGSGLIVSADGYILTNAHVVALAEQEKTVAVTLNSGSKYKAQIVFADDDADMALLKIEDKAVQFPYFDLQFVSPNLLGETVVALGSPEGYQKSVSHGILSAKNRTFSVEGHTYTNLLQTDAAINPGNSGGPLVDINGALVGINSAKLAGEAIENIGFAIPNEIVVPWTNDALAVARGQKPAAVARSQSILEMVHDHLGLGLKTLTPEKAAELGTEIGGLVITDVQEDSPADRAGLKKDMIVVGIGNRQITDEKTLPHELEHLQAGTNVRVQVIYVQVVGPFVSQRGGSVMLVSR